jgi:outer membrane receptor for ferrienterochelin and colicin
VIKKKQIAAYLCTMALVGGGLHSEIVSAAAPSYELDQIDVIGDKVLAEEESEQAYYRTGGDVTVINRQDIENRHYANIKEAIKRIPGVQISNPGYHAHEYGTTFSEEITINGDSSVIIVVDGKRLDNEVSSYAANKSKTSLEMITNIANVERIEVIKGASASIYGSDATGGVINIITRKGTRQPQTTLDLATGSWGKHNYAITHSGSTEDGSLKYFFSLNREQSGDTKYKDAELDSVVRFLNTGYQDNGASFRVDKEFDKNHALNFSYSHTDSLAHYPITAPQYSTLDRLYSDELYQDYRNKVGSKAVGYRNWFLYDAALGSYTKSQTNDYSVKYTYNNENGMESFLRLYENRNRYNTKDYSGLFGKPQSYMTPENIALATSNKYASLSREDAKGLEVQYAKKIDKHNLITGWNFNTSTYESINKSKGTCSSRERDSIYGFLQDKIQVTDKWLFTPGIRYNKYDSIERVSTAGIKSSNDGASQISFNAQTKYQFDNTLNAYFSWSEVYRPMTNYDYDNQSSFEKLNNEKGNNWAIGMNKAFSSKTSANVNYGLLDMSNAIARYSVWDPEAVNTESPDGKGNWATKSINATQKKKAFNFGLKHEFDDNWGISASYAYVMENFHAKNWKNNPDDTNVDAMINSFRPTNKYQMDVMYHKDKWSGDLSTELYSGLNTRYYTNNRFLVVGLDVNYDINKDTRIYFAVDNLTNIAYETRISSTYKYGAFPQPSRSFMLGVQYRF